MKKLLSLLLCVMMVSSMLIVTTVSVGAYEFSNYLSDNFNSYTGEKNPYVSQCAANSGSISISPYSRGDGDTAVLATVSGDSIVSNNAPAFQWVINAHKGEFAAKGITLSADVMIEEFTANESGMVFGIDVRNSGATGWYYGSSKKGTFNADGTVSGGGAFATQKWYNLEITFNYNQHVYNAVLTDLETGSKTVLAQGEKFLEAATNVSIVNFELYCPSKVAIDNLSLKEAPIPAIYFPVDGAAADMDKINADVCLPEYITEASVYLDDEKIEDIALDDSKVMYQLSFKAEELGDHTVSLIAKDESGNVYADKKDIKTTTSAKQYIKDYSFATAYDEYYIGIDLTGGVGGNSSHSYSLVQDGTNYYGDFKITAKSTDDLFMRYGIAESLTGQYKLGLIAKAMQTTEDMVVTLEGNTSITLLGADGCIAGTSKAYAKDTWYDFDIEFDNTTKLYTIYVDGEFLTSGTFGSTAAITGIRVYMRCRNSDNAEYLFDHLSLEKTSYVKNYGFTDSSTYYIGQSLNGGVAGYSHSYSRISDGSNYYGKFTFKGQDAGTDPVFVRYDSGSNHNGKYQIYVRAAAMQTNEKFNIQLEGIKNINILNNNGYIATTQIPYAANTWYDIYINLDTVGGTYDLYVGDKYILSSSFTAGTPLKALRINMYGNNNTAASYELDHLSVVSVATTPKAEKVVSVTGGVENDIIVTDSDSVRVYFDSPLKADSVIAKNVTATSGDTALEISSVTYSEESDYVEIVFAEDLPMVSEVEITFSKALATESGTFGYPYVTKVQTGVSSVTEYGNLTITSTDFSVSGAIDIYFAEEAGSAVIAVAGYDGNKMTDVSIEPYSLKYGKNVLTASITDVEGTTFKAFLFDSMSGIKPMLKNAE